MGLSANNLSYTKALIGAFFLPAFFVIAGCAHTQQPSFAVASAHPAATQAGIDIMLEGGNAFDAAVAVTAALAVVEPYGSGIGGGGFFLFYIADEDRHVMIDAREKAPSKAHKDLYWNPETQEYDGKMSLNGPLAAGIPGIAAAFDHIAENYGERPLNASLASAIALAENGVTLDPRYLKLVNFRGGVMSEYPETKKIYLLNGEALNAKSVLRQPDLANVLQHIAGKGRDGFYAGDVAQKMVSDVQANGGIWTMADLADYQVVEREPIVAEFYGRKIVSAAPPSSGGIVLAQALKILELLDYQAQSAPVRTHLSIEAMRRAYRDRAMYLGDPDFVDIPYEKLLNEAYLREYSRTIDKDKATSSGDLPAVYVDQNAGEDTSHFSVIDANGNFASVTLSINYPFGSCFVPAGTGVLLNNEMDDFATHPGVPNAYGLVGNDANAVEAGKRPLSSMSPSIVHGPDGVAVIGTPGGSRIISMVMLAILDMLESNAPAHWVSLPRYHHQYLPDSIQFEEGYIDEGLLEYWRGLGHELRPISRRYGNMQALHLEKASGRITGASDPRGHGFTKIGYAPKATH